MHWRAEGGGSVPLWGMGFDNSRVASIALLYNVIYCPPDTAADVVDGEEYVVCEGCVAEEPAGKEEKETAPYSRQPRNTQHRNRRTWFQGEPSMHPGVGWGGGVRGGGVKGNR